MIKLESEAWGAMSPKSKAQGGAERPTAGVEPFKKRGKDSPKQTRLLDSFEKLTNMKPFLRVAVTPARISPTSPKKALKSGRELWGVLRNALNNNDSLQKDIQLSRMIYGRRPEFFTLKEEVVKKGKSPTFDECMHPESKFKHNWDFFQFVFLIYIAVIVPIRVAFAVQAHGLGFMLSVIVDIYFTVDLVFNFFTPFEEAGFMETDRGSIRRHYLCSWFVPDLISIIPIDYITRAMDNTLWCSFWLEGCEGGSSGVGVYLKVFRMLRMARLVKLLRLARLRRLLTRYQDDMMHVSPILLIIKIIALMLFISHIFGCAFYFFSTRDMWYEEDYVRMRDNGLLPWLVVEFGDNYDSSPLGQRYLAAFYWSFTTMSTVGYGDITATTSMERMFAIVSMITGSFFFSVIMTHVMTELENSNMHHNALNHKMYTVKMFVNDLQLNKTERRSVLGYFRTQDVKPYDERELLFEMPFDMRNRILQYLYKDLFANVPIFMNSDDVYKTELCSRVQPVSLQKGSFVYRKGEIGFEMFFISSGEVEVVDPLGRKVFGIFGRGCFFGEGVLVGKSIRSYSVRCRTSCLLLSLSHSDMNELSVLDAQVLVQLRRIHQKRLHVFAPPNRAQSVIETVKRDCSLVLGSTVGTAYSSVSRYSGPSDYSVSDLDTAGGFYDTEGEKRSAEGKLKKGIEGYDERRFDYRGGSGCSDDQSESQSEAQSSQRGWKSTLGGSRPTSPNVPPKFHRSSTEGPTELLDNEVSAAGMAHRGSLEIEDDFEQTVEEDEVERIPRFWGSSNALDKKSKTKGETSGYFQHGRAGNTGRMMEMLKKKSKNNSNLPSFTNTMDPPRAAEQQNILMLRHILDRVASIEDSIAKISAKMGEQQAAFRHNPA